MSLSKCDLCGEMVLVRLTFHPKEGRAITLCLDCDDEWQAQGDLRDLDGREKLTPAEWVRIFDSLRKFVARKKP